MEKVRKQRLNEINERLSQQDSPSPQCMSNSKENVNPESSVTNANLTKPILVANIHLNDDSNSLV